MTGEQKYKMGKIVMICVTLISIALVVSVHDQRMMELRMEQGE